jgi:acetyl esterase
MRVVSVSAARGIALAALIVAGFVVTGCVAQSTPTVAHSARHILGKRAVAVRQQVAVVPDLTYRVADGVSLRLDVCLPPTSADVALSFRPAIVVIHGGSWMLGDKAEPVWRDVCTWLASSGYVVASVDYRLAPAYHYPDEISDVEAAVEWMRAPAQTRRFGIDPTMVGAFGGSAGGNLAALLGTAGSGAVDVGHRVASVVDLSGPANLTVTGAEAPLIKDHVLTYLGCTSFSSCPQDVAASPVDNVDSSDPPFLILNSSNELIPLSESLQFATRLRAARVPVTLDVVPGTLHSISMLTPLLRTSIIDFYRSTLVHREPPTATS